MEPETKGFFEATRRLVEEYVKERVLLLKLQTAEKTARVVSFVFAACIFGLLSFFILFFLSLMVGYFFARLTGNIYYGFGIVTAIYVLLLVIFYSFRKKWLYKYFSDLVVKQFFENSDTADAKQKS